MSQCNVLEVVLVYIHIVHLLLNCESGQYTHWAGRPWFDSRWDFLFITTFRPAEAHPVSYPMGTGVSFLKSNDRDAKLTTHLHLVRVWSYNSTPPYVYMVWCLVKHREQLCLLPFTSRLQTSVTRFCFDAANKSLLKQNGCWNNSGTQRYLSQMFKIKRA
jgi:hypothetical protein